MAPSHASAGSIVVLASEGEDALVRQQVDASRKLANALRHAVEQGRRVQLWPHEAAVAPPLPRCRNVRIVPCAGDVAAFEAAQADGTSRRRGGRRGPSEAALMKVCWRRGGMRVHFSVNCRLVCIKPGTSFLPASQLPTCGLTQERFMEATAVLGTYATHLSAPNLVGLLTWRPPQPPQQPSEHQYPPGTGGGRLHCFSPS